MGGAGKSTYFLTVFLAIPRSSAIPRMGRPAPFFS